MKLVILIRINYIISKVIDKLQFENLNNNLYFKDVEKVGI